MKHPCDCLGRQHSPVIWNGMEHPDCNHLQLLFELQGDCEKCDTNRKQRPSMKTRRRQVGIFHQNYKWLWRSAWKQSKNMKVFGDFTQRQPAPTHLLQWVRKYSFFPSLCTWHHTRNFYRHWQRWRFVKLFQGKKIHPKQLQEYNVNKNSLLIQHVWLAERAHRIHVVVKLHYMKRKFL